MEIVIPSSKKAMMGIITSPTLRSVSNLSGGQYLKPTSREQYKVDVEAGDILTVGTDGLFDNMFENQIKDVAEKSTEEGIDPALVARAVAESAYQISLDKNATTPFMLASSKSKRHRSGGKVVDITVIVAYIVHD
nr:probable protein phosphatase 2C 80 [Quercus suber]